MNRTDDLKDNLVEPFYIQPPIYKARRRFSLISLLLVLFVLSTGTGLTAERGKKSEQKLRLLKEAIEGGRARNVILMIGDGMDDSIITATRNYLVGAAGKLALDELPLTGQMTTFSVREDAPSKPDYDPESASTSTAWSTGFKTSDGRISTAPGTGQINIRDARETKASFCKWRALISTNESTLRNPARL